MATTPTISGYTSASGNSVSATFVIDPGANILSGDVGNGDWIIATFSSASNYGATNLPTPPGGWTTILPLTGVGSGTTTFGIWAHQRAAGETTYTWSQTTGGNSTNSRLLFIRGAADIGNWIIGSFDFRENTGTTTTNVAASITTTVNNSLAVLLSEERTIAAETDAQVTCTNLTKFYFDNTVGDQTVMAASKDMVTAASVGSATVTYPNTHSFNGIAGILGIPPHENHTTLMWIA